MNRFQFALTFALLIGLLGFVISRGSVLTYIASLDPASTFFLSYAVLFGWIVLVAFVLTKRPPDLNLFRTSLALVILTFAFGIVLYWPASTCSVLATGGTPSLVPSFLLGTEDQVVCQSLMAVGITNLSALLFLTYVLVPFVLIFASVYLIAPKQASTFLRTIVGRV